ncbi:MAG: DUF885 domain-containing protein [Hyphomonadaceae bacterium]
MALLVVAGCTPERVNADPALTQLVDRFGASEIQQLPEEADLAGLSDKAFGRAYGALLNDRSMAVTERTRTIRLDYLAEFERIDRADLSPAAARTYDTINTTLANSVAADAHGYGATSLGWTSPYVISFSDGAFTDLVKLLTLHAPIRSRAQADAWLARLGHMDEAMRDERRRFEVDLEAGAIPPRSVIQRTLDKAHQLAPVGNPRDHLLVQYFTETVAQVADIPEADITTLTTKAAKLVGGDIKDEYDKLISLLEKTLPKATDDPGVWKLPRGDAYYADALRLHTTTSLTAKQLHDMGLKLVEQVTAQLDPLLAAQGLAEGTVGQRLRVLSLNPQFQFPETPEGRTALLDAIGARMKWAEGVTVKVADVDKPAQIVVRETPRIAQDTASKAFYRAAPLSGGQPAVYNITLRATADFPMWTLPSLTFHEAVPGHHLQVEVARDQPNLPVVTYLMSTPAFSEGWATYAEDLADELGAYESDPLGKIGYLQSMLFRAARLVADTGIHGQKWKRQEAIDYLVNTVGLALPNAELEVDRYAIRPGLACAYMTGREAIRRLRASAQKELGKGFDLKAFHEAILEPGPRPLPVVEADIAAWIASKKPPPPPAQ